MLLPDKPVIIMTDAGLDVRGLKQSKSDGF